MQTHPHPHPHPLPAPHLPLQPCKISQTSLQNPPNTLASAVVVSQDRCHRIGQTREVHIYRLISQNTIEENILRKSDQKRQLDWLAIQSGGFNTDFLSKINVGESGLPFACLHMKYVFDVGCLLSPAHYTNLSSHS